MCKKQISVSHSSTEAEVISLDAGFRMDGIPALDLWDLVIEVFHSSPNQTNNTRDDRESRGNLSAKTQPNMRKQIPTMHTNLDLTDIDHVPSIVTHSGCNAMLYVFEDNEAVIKMIIKGWSPTMRHVSRTHRVALNWLFDRINLDSKIQNRYIDTKHQLTDSLTKGNFTRDEWDNLLHSFNISHFSSTCCSLNSSLTSCPEKIAKRMREQKGEERSAAKSKSTGLRMFRQVLQPRKFRLHLKARGYSQPQGKDEKKFELRRSVEFSSEAARCILWRVDGQSKGETCRNRRRIRWCGSFRIWNLELSWRGSDWETGCWQTVTGKPGASSKSGKSENPKAERK